MKLLIILGLAVTAMATSLESPQVIRIGSVSVTVADVQGTLTPKGDSSDAVPVFEFKSPGSAENETEMYNFRCNVITKFYQPESAHPILICRNTGFNKESSGSYDKKAFLFTHSGLNLAPQIKEVELLVGKTTIANFVKSHADPTTRKMLAMEGSYDGYQLFEGNTSPYHTFLSYTI